MARWPASAPAADRRLVKGLHDGDREALAALYDTYAERLYDYCVALLGEPADADGIVHDTLIDATRRAPRMREREHLRAWLYAGVRRRCLRHGQPGAMGSDAFAQRDALILAYRHGLDVDDLAAVLGIARWRAQVRLRRAAHQVPDVRERLLTAEEPTPPTGLRRRVLHAGSDPELASYRAEIAARGGALTAEGMPRQPDAPSWLARRWVVACGMSISALCLAFATLLITGPPLPVPDWPGPSEHQQRSPGRHSDTPAAPIRTRPPGARRPPTAGTVRLPAPTPSPSPGSGGLTVNPVSIHFTGGVRVADLRLAADGGPVAWTAVGSSLQISVSADHGRMHSGGHTTIHVTLDRSLLTLPGTATLTLSDDMDHSIAVPVSWDLSVL